MFEWKVEDMVLLNQKGGIFRGREKIYNCENETSREDKIAFVDSMQDGKLSYLLSLIDKFNQDYDSLPKQKTYLDHEEVKTVSLKAWIKRNDTKYGRPLIDDNYKYGEYYILGTRRYITSNIKDTYDTYEDLVDEVFHRQLKKCEQEEKKYFLEHDEYSILKKELREMMDKYRTTFGVHISYCSSGAINIHSSEDIDKDREITIDELKALLEKYKQLEEYINKLSGEIHITY